MLINLSLLNIWSEIWRRFLTLTFCVFWYFNLRQLIDNFSTIFWSVIFTKADWRHIMAAWERIFYYVLSIMYLYYVIFKFYQILMRLNSARLTYKELYYQYHKIKVGKNKNPATNNYNIHNEKLLKIRTNLVQNFS